METALTATVSVALICLALGVIIGVVAKIFAVKVDPNIEIVEGLLPGANCGGCGFAGCSDFAKAVVAGDAEPGGCPVCSAANVGKIAEALGRSAGAKEKMVAIVLCGGGVKKAKPAVEYNGVSDCKSAALIAGGFKGCAYGCMGLASCARACPFGAIEMVEGLAVVHPELCVGCGKCVEACPRNLIKLVPASAEVHVYCSSPEKGPLKRKVCEVSCIGCRKCVKADGEGRMEMDGFLAKVNYDNPPPPSVVEEAKCPTGAFR